MVSLRTYQMLRRKVAAAGHQEAIDWAQNLKPPKSARKFASAVIFVMLSAGIREQAVAAIHERVMVALRRGDRASSAPYRHRAKAGAIDNVWRCRKELFSDFKHHARNLAELLDWLGTLPFVGPVTRYHLARNLGFYFVKPDRHLARLVGASERRDPIEEILSRATALCERLSSASGDRVGTVDLVLWRAANLRILPTLHLRR